MEVPLIRLHLVVEFSKTLQYYPHWPSSMLYYIIGFMHIISKFKHTLSYIVKFKMIIDQLKCLQEYLTLTNRPLALQALKAELLARIPHKPSHQLLTLLHPKSSQQIQPPSMKEKKRQDGMKKKKGQMVVEGLLGRIAYSSKLIEDTATNEKIGKLMDNKIFLKAVARSYPQIASKLQQQAGGQAPIPYEDELQLTEMPNPSQSPSPSPLHISAIDLQQPNASSILSHPSYILAEINKIEDIIDEYLDDNDLGYEEYTFMEDQLMKGCKQLTQKYKYPECAVRSQEGGKSKENKQNCKKKIEKRLQTKKKSPKFPPELNFPSSSDPHYPLEYNGVIYDTMNLPCIFHRERIGAEPPDLQFHQNDILAGRYQILAVLGSGVFARVLKVKDLLTQEDTCFKMVSNNKDFFDQALDEIKLLKFVKSNCDPSKNHLLQFKSVFYHREQLFIQTDLLRDNLYVAYRKNPSWFSIPTIRQISKQLLIGLKMLHSLQIIHADLKPQNILIKTYSPVEVKIIDLGNSCFNHDVLGSYVQSRSYRAPQVILGCGYDEKIDIWSLGCILAELWTKNVLFYNIHIQGMLARMQSIVGPWPQWMIQGGQQVSNYFSKENLIFYEDQGKYNILVPKRTSLKARIRTQDEYFLSFLQMLLQIDPTKRVSAKQALLHPFLHCQ